MSASGAVVSSCFYFFKNAISSRHSAAAQRHPRIRKTPARHRGLARRTALRKPAPPLPGHEPRLLQNENGPAQRGAATVVDNVIAHTTNTQQLKPIIGRPICSSRLFLLVALNGQRILPHPIYFSDYIQQMHFFKCLSHTSLNLILHPIAAIASGDSFEAFLMVELPEFFRVVFADRGM